MARSPNGQVVERKRKGGCTFALRFQAYGRRRYLTLGTAEEGWDRRRAEEELSNVLADVRRGIWRPPQPAQANVELGSEISFHEFASEWLEEVNQEGLKPNTIAEYRWELCDHLLPAFAGHRLTEITVAEVDRYRQAKVGEGALSATSINKTITRLGQILEVAVERELIARNPARGRRRHLKQRAPQRTWLDRADQIGALLAAGGELDEEARADRRGVPRRGILATLALAGLRIGEALALRWRDVDLAAGRLRVRDSKTDAGVREVDLRRSGRSSPSTRRRPDSGTSTTSSSRPPPTASSIRATSASVSWQDRSSGRTRDSPRPGKPRCQTGSRRTRCGAPSSRCCSRAAPRSGT
jgi:integrase